MYQKSNGKAYGGLGDYFGATNKSVRKVPVRPNAYIPKPKVHLDTYDAMRLALRMEKVKTPIKPEDNIYWKHKHGESLPIFSTTGNVGLEYLGPMTPGRKKVKITPPPIKLKNITKKIRDLPVVESLQPIVLPAGGFGMFDMVKKPKLVCVLGLLLLGLHLYNK